VLLEQRLGPLGGRYFFDPVGEVSFVVEKLEDDLVGFFPASFPWWATIERLSPLKPIAR
jgi:hypothetical protein